MNYANWRLDDDESICPISLDLINPNENKHPKEIIYISHCKENKSVAYEARLFEDWVKSSTKFTQANTIKIPHCNITVNGNIANQIRERLQFHIKALDKFPDMTYKIVKENAEKWTEEYIDNIKKNVTLENNTLRDKIYYFCEPIHFKKYLLYADSIENKKKLRVYAINLINDKSNLSFIMRKTSIIDTKDIKNIVFTVKKNNEIFHYPLRHRYGFGYFFITKAEINASVKDTTDKYIGPSFLDTLNYCNLNISNIISIY